MGKNICHKKTQQLGMPIGTASNRLRKNILYEFIVRLNLDVCFQCGKKIENVDDLSIEHKIPWLDSVNPKEKFFDIDNITFSHLKCNASAARRQKISKFCGTSTSYLRGCRCEKCVVARSKHRKETYCVDERRARYLRTGN